MFTDKWIFAYQCLSVFIGGENWAITKRLLRPCGQQAGEGNQGSPQAITCSTDDLQPIEQRHDAVFTPQVEAKRTQWKGSSGKERQAAAVADCRRCASHPRSRELPESGSLLNTEARRHGEIQDCCDIEFVDPRSSARIRGRILVLSHRPILTHSWQFPLNFHLLFNRGHT